ncbi:hypothetical protein ACN6K9_002921 [Streptomyces sp. SAS_267]|uniref:hypothetical protein n=1 Tax=Streptomyces sp. SAS_267 TaxID=3412750 RepID=UPI00403CF426
MNRATAVLTDWNNRVNQSTASKHDQAQVAEITRLRSQLRNNRRERQRLQDEVDAAATVVAALAAENAALREQAAHRAPVVIPLNRAHSTQD